MADVKKYYYLRLKDNFFESDSMILLEDMQDGYIYSNILLKLYLKSLKDEGRLMLNGRIPYNARMLASVTRHQVGTVEKALDIFKELGLIEIIDNGAIYMLDIQNFIGESTTEADRKRVYRRRIEEEKIGIGQMDGQMDGQNSTRDRDRDRDKDKDRDIKQDSTLLPKNELPEPLSESRKKINYQQIADMYNDTCVSFPRLTTLSEKRKKAIRARMKQYSLEDFQRMFSLAEESDFMKGKNQRNWSATFDWMICDANMAKILDGNYKSKDTKEGEPFGAGERRSKEDEDLLDNVRKANSWHSPYPIDES